MRKSFPPPGSSQRLRLKAGKTSKGRSKLRPIQSFTAWLNRVLSNGGDVGRPRRPIPSELSAIHSHGHIIPTVARSPPLLVCTSHRPYGPSSPSRFAPRTLSSLEQLVPALRIPKPARLTIPLNLPYCRRAMLRVLPVHLDTVSTFVFTNAFFARCRGFPRRLLFMS